jgi:predicted DNA-binding protein with PD1-like motif
LIKYFATRLKSGSDLRQSIAEYANANNITAGTIICGVGHLTSLVVRLADATPGHSPQIDRSENFEIVSLTGTVEMDDLHLHISAADSNGNVIGGHLRPGCIIGITVELVILAESGLEFKRELDHENGFDCLVVKELPHETIQSK